LKLTKPLQERETANIKSISLKIGPDSASPELLPPFPRNVETEAQLQTWGELEAIRSTPYANSFMSRLQGSILKHCGAISVDWEMRTPWMDLMRDIREHFTLRRYCDFSLLLSIA
jgi:hypothetical protein